MGHPSDSVSNVKPRDLSLAPVALLGALAATGGVSAYLAWPARRTSVSTRKRQALIAYLRDHLSGADMAIRVVHRLGSTHQNHRGWAVVPSTVKRVGRGPLGRSSTATRLGASGRSIKRVAGYASGAVLSVTAGGEPGDLSLLRTLEALSIGVQGKRCMWRALQNLSPTGSRHELRRTGSEGGSPMGGH